MVVVVVGEWGCGGRRIREMRRTDKQESLTEKVKKRGETEGAGGVGGGGGVKNRTQS